MLTVERLREQFRQTFARVGKPIRSAGITSLYGLIVSSVLLPLYQAMSGGPVTEVEKAGALTAAGIGGNLIAGHLARWFTSVQPEGTIAADAAANSALRGELDQLLERLNALEIAGATLADDDRAWFAATLRDELDRLGNLPRHETALAKIMKIRVRQEVEEIEGEVDAGEYADGTPMNLKVEQKAKVVRKGGRLRGPRIN